MDNSPTNQLADRQTRRQSNSPTIKLAKKNQLAEIEIVTKIDVRCKAPIPSQPTRGSGGAS